MSITGEWTVTAKRPLTSNTLTVNPWPAMVVTRTCAKTQGLSSVSSEDRVETNRRTDGHHQSHYLPL